MRSKHLRWCERWGSSSCLVWMNEGNGINRAFSLRTRILEKESRSNSFACSHWIFWYATSSASGNSSTAWIYIGKFCWLFWHSSFSFSHSWISISPDSRIIDSSLHQWYEVSSDNFLENKKKNVSMKIFLPCHFMEKNSPSSSKQHSHSMNLIFFLMN